MQLVSKTSESKILISLNCSDNVTRHLVQPKCHCLPFRHKSLKSCPTHQTQTRNAWNESRPLLMLFQSLFHSLLVLDEISKLPLFRTSPPEKCKYLLFVGFCTQLTYFTCCKSCFCFQSFSSVVRSSGQQKQWVLLEAP